MRKLSLILGLWLFTCLLAIDAQPVSAQASSTSQPTSVPDTPTYTPASGLTPNPSAIFQTATPGADGRIIHKVVAGQSLISIAEAYGVDINDLLALNGLSRDDVIYPDQELVIQAGFTATPTLQPSATATQTIVPTSTRRPTRTPTSSIEPGSTDDLIEQTQAVSMPNESSSQSGSDSIGKFLLVAIAILGLSGILMIVVGAVLRRSS